MDYSKFIVAVEYITGSDHENIYFMNKHVTALNTVFQRVLARAELKADVSESTHFVSSGEAFSAVVAVSNIVSMSKRSVRFLDPYSDISILKHFAVLSAENLHIEILADKDCVKPNLIPAAEAWQKQYGNVRPLEIRLAPKRTLHDRAIFLDSKKVWVVGQSFNALATRAATTMVPMEGDAADLKVQAYEELWNKSEVAFSI